MDPNEMAEMNRQLSELQSGSAGLASMGIGVMIFYIAILVLMVASFWQIFTKAGKPGWAAIIPIYNAIVFLQIINRPVWWIVLFLIPIVNFVIAIIVSIDLAKVFGKGTGFGVGLLLLGIVFYPLLAFGDAQYQGASSAEAG